MSSLFPIQFDFRTPYFSFPPIHPHKSSLNSKKQQNANWKSIFPNFAKQRKLTNHIKYLRRKKVAKSLGFIRKQENEKAAKAHNLPALLYHNPNDKSNEINLCTNNAYHIQALFLVLLRKKSCFVSFLSNFLLDCVFPGV